MFGKLLEEKHLHDMTVTEHLHTYNLMIIG